MIRVRLQGRLGNQLFQYAFAMYASSRLKTKCVFEIRAEDGFQLKWFRLRFPYNLLYVSFFYKAYNRYQRFIKTEKSFSALNGKEDWSKTLITDSTSYRGYFQDARFSSGIKSLLQNELSVKKKYADLFYNQYSSFLNGKYAVLHIRLSDYENQKIVINREEADWMLPVLWYHKTLERIDRAKLKLVIVSDDMKKAKELFDDGSDTIYFPPGDTITHFQLILHADVCIISNSSFAWWAAFLNNKPHKKVYAPNNWVGYNLGVEFPKGIMIKEFEWIQ
ncbi:MAG: alpha-1,2-fucosyltransferase [Chitinophagaceae bacterium]|nr:alpha-1,2-fucosyltransferase [Chitinophagaceae bacterium]